MSPGEIVVLDQYPVIILHQDSMVFSRIGAWLYPQHESTLKIVEDIKNGKLPPFIFTVMSVPGVDKAPERFFTVGVVASLEISKEEDGDMVTLQGFYRAKADNWSKGEEYWLASIKPLEDLYEPIFSETKGVLTFVPDAIDTVQAALFEIKQKLENLVGVLLNDDDDSEENAKVNKLIEVYDNFDNHDFTLKASADQLIWKVLAVVPFMTQVDKQAVLESVFTSERLALVLALLDKSIRIAYRLKRIEKIIENQGGGKTKTSNPNYQHGGGLVRTSKNDPNDFASGMGPELAEKYAKFLEIKQFMNEDAIKSVIDSFKRLKLLNGPNGEASGSEWTVFMSHIDFVLEVPWRDSDRPSAEIDKVEEALNKDHYGLNFAKTPILRYLAGKNLNPKGKSGSLLFVGPPGVGKTSLANSIAGALGRKLIRLPLGGVHDEAEIRGHRKTYIGALAGQIMQEMRRAGEKDPIFVLDELDKVSSDFRGDPAAALLEVLDPEQNHSFRDHYLDAPYDLSQVLFIGTANGIAGIRPALLDRMEPILLPGYTSYEKIQIAKQFLIPKVVSEVGLDKKGIDLRWPGDTPDSTLLNIIKGYTKEAGVRNVERMLKTLCRALAYEYQKSKEMFTNPIIDDEFVAKVLGQPRYTSERAKKTDIGEVIGLAWTEAGGDILYVQSMLLPKSRGKEFSQTGLLGEVMREADKIAMSLIRHKLEQVGKLKILENKFIHIHVPAGAIEKDGPSAGITAYCSLYSELFQIEALPLVAMTGEITLKGRVTGVGGIKEKVIAAENAGIHQIVLPESNKKDLDEVPQSAKDRLKFHFVEYVDQVTAILFPGHSPA